MQYPYIANVPNGTRARRLTWRSEYTMKTMPASGEPRPLRAFTVEVKTEEGQYARYNAISTSSCAALLSALDTWGIAKISISPRTSAA
jgi:hypothetical protein